MKFKVLDAKTQVPAFGAGQCDVMTTPPSAIPRVTEQYKLKVAEFFPLARWTIGPQILVKKGSPYTTLASLKGKKVAITPLNTRFGSEEAAIEAATGQNIRSYFKLEQTNAAAQQLTLGRVDAAFIEAPTTYPLLQGGKFKAIYSVHDAFLKAFGDPAVVNGGYIARTSFIRSAAGSRFTKDLVAATQKVWNQYVKDPNSVNSVASKQSGIAVPMLAVVGQVLDLQKMPARLRAITPQDVKSWQKIFPCSPSRASSRPRPRTWRPCSSSRSRKRLRARHPHAILVLTETELDGAHGRRPRVGARRQRPPRSEGLGAAAGARLPVRARRGDRSCSPGSWGSALPGLHPAGPGSRLGLVHEQLGPRRLDVRRRGDPRAPVRRVRADDRARTADRHPDRALLGRRGPHARLPDLPADGSDRRPDRARAGLRRGHVAAVVAVTIASCFTYFTLNVIQGTKAIDRDLVEMARTYEASELTIMRSIIVPSVVPYFLAGARITLGVAWQVTLFGEYLMGIHGVGFQISGAIGLLNTPDIYMWGLSVVLLTIAFEYGFFRPLEWLLTRNARRAT